MSEIVGAFVNTELHHERADCSVETGDGPHPNLHNRRAANPAFTMLAADALMMALEIEGWVTQRPRTRQITRIASKNAAYIAARNFLFAHHDHVGGLRPQKWELPMKVNIEIECTAVGQAILWSTQSSRCKLQLCSRVLPVPCVGHEYRATLITMARRANRYANRDSSR